MDPDRWIEGKHRPSVAVVVRNAEHTRHGRSNFGSNSVGLQQRNRAATGLAADPLREPLATSIHAAPHGLTPAGPVYYSAIVST